jgi:hypothetical protein
VGGRAEDAHAAAGVLGDSEAVQACSGEGRGFEEVGGKDRLCLTAQEGRSSQVIAGGAG